MNFSVTGPERQDRVHRLVFNRDHLKQLQSAIVKLFNVFHDVLEKEFEYGSYFKHTEILDRLDNLENTSWNDIRLRFLEDKFHGYRDRNFTDDELKDPAKLLLDMIDHITLFKDSVYEKIEQKHHEVLAAEEKTRQYEEKADDAIEKLLQEKRVNKEKLLDAAKVRSKLEHMEKVLDEKNAKLMELQRTTSCNLWEREKEKVLKDASERIQELEQENDALRKSTVKITRRMSNLDDQNKMYKLKNEISNNSTGSEESVDVQALKRENYMKEKDISRLEDELYNQQKLFVGLTAGLKTDINILSERFYDEETCTRDPDFMKLSRSAERVYNAALDGKLVDAKMMLPPHYSFHDKMQNIKFSRVRRLSKCNVLAPINDMPVRTPLPDIQPTNLNSTALPPLSENPIIVDPSTDKLNGMIYLKHFPHMAQNFILDHWQKFKDFDRNSDLSLDLQEVVKLLQSLHCEYTPGQIQEAMEEVDLDDSHTLDFYEYLLVVEKIMRKSGKAKLFKKGLAKQSNPEVSKACVIQ